MSVNDGSINHHEQNDKDDLHIHRITLPLHRNYYLKKKIYEEVYKIDTGKFKTDEQVAKFENVNPSVIGSNSSLNNKLEHVNNNNLKIERIISEVHKKNSEQIKKKEVNNRDIQRIMAEVQSKRPENLVKCTYRNNRFDYDDGRNHTLDDDSISSYEAYQKAQLQRIHYQYGPKEMNTRTSLGGKFRPNAGLDSDTLFWISTYEALIRAQIHREDET